MPETKAIINAMTSFLFITMKFDLQNNGFFSEKVSYLQRILKNTGLRQAQAPYLFVKAKVLEPL